MTDAKRNESEIRKAVRGRYGAIARKSGSCCGPAPSCCGSAGRETVAATAGKRIGYTEAEMQSVPDGANLGLGCGNPLAHAAIRPGETVLDLGAGAGFDCFLAAKATGPSGRVIGVDMTPEMVEKARANARKGGYANVEFRLGEIESLPVGDGAVDCVISNCVINLAPDKARVFREAFRVLKPGGRLMVSDIVLRRELPAAVKSSIAAYTGCIAGATSKEEYLGALEAAGFREIRVVAETGFPVEVAADGPLAKAAAEDFGLAPGELAAAAAAVTSLKVFAVKPVPNA